MSAKNHLESLDLSIVGIIRATLGKLCPLFDLKGGCKRRCVGKSLRTQTSCVCCLYGWLLSLLCSNWMEVGRQQYSLPRISLVA